MARRKRLTVLDPADLGLTLREPLQWRPLRGLAVGLFSGAFFGLLGGVADFPNSRGAVFVGYTLGGALAGLIVGAALPFFRHRVVAGLVVGVAAATWGTIALEFSGDPLHWVGSLFIGLTFALTYGVLLWDYRADGAA